MGVNQYYIDALITRFRVANTAHSFMLTKHWQWFKSAFLNLG